MTDYVFILKKSEARIEQGLISSLYVNLLLRCFTKTGPYLEYRRSMGMILGRQVLARKGHFIV